MTDPRSPRTAPPLGACDVHVHVYDPAYALAPTALGPAPDASLADYLAQRNRLGIARTVIVQPTAYGADNSCMLAAIAKLDGSGRGVAMVGPNVTTAELAQLHAGGIRGFRMRAFPGGVLDFAGLEKVARRAALLDWHVDLEIDGRTLPDHEDLLARLPLPIVVDHIGKFGEPVALDHPGVNSLLHLLSSGRVYVKLSAPYDSSRSGGPAFADLVPLIELILQEAPDRVLWASNWPHAALAPAKRPDDADWLDRLAELVPDEKMRHAILVDTPAKLYRF